MANRTNQPKLPDNSYAFQNLELNDIEGEQWKDLPGLKDYFMISNLGRIKRLEFQTQYKNGAVYTKREKIIKPHITRNENKIMPGFNMYVVNRIVLNKKRYSLLMGRWMYYCFVKEFDITDPYQIILYKDNNKLNIHPSNLKLATKKERLQQMKAENRYVSGFSQLSETVKKRQRERIAQSLQKKVSQYSLCGKKLKTFGSLVKAQKATGVHSASIGAAASYKILTAGGYVWRFGNYAAIDVDDIRKERRIKSKDRYGQKVTQYDLKGNRIAQYPSLQDAEKASGANANAIRLVIKEKYKSAKGFIWKPGYGEPKIDLSGYKTGRASMAATQSKKVNQFNLKGLFLKTYSSIKEAATSVNVSPVCIVDVCKGRSKTSAGFIWKYA